ncbi:hypothetical protein M5689_019098 [Euphorbia peplus]|nr:hypothetical protein M5689_019098 [Euphorbia peplus]
MGSSFEAKLWGLFSGLSLAINLNIRLLQVESDNKEAVEFLTRMDHLPGRARNLVVETRRLLCQFEGVEIKHVYREQNRVADLLVATIHEAPLGFQRFDHPPILAARIIQEDLLGVAFDRFVAF